MKLSKAEIAAIIITIIFIALTAVFSLSSNGSGSAVTISVQRSEAPEEAVSQNPPSPESSIQTPVNINTATVKDLCALPGIGEKLAERIIEYREKNGPFKNADEIMSVSGIGAETYRDIKNSITTD